MYTREMLPGMRLYHKNYVKSKEIIYILGNIREGEYINMRWEGIQEGTYAGYNVNDILVFIRAGIWIPETTLTYQIY